MINLKNRERLALQTVLIAIIVIVAVVYALFIRPNYFNFNGGKIVLETVYSEKMSSKDDYQIYSYNDSIYLSSKNGLKKMSIDRESIWDKAFYIKEPLFLAEDGYMATVNLGGKEAYLFDEKGLIMNIKVDYPIILADISNKGVLVLVQENAGKHLIHVYNRKGILAVARVTNFKTDGFPIGIDLSSTGEKMVTSHLTFLEGKMNSMITFLNFKEEGDKDAQDVLGGFILEGSMAAEVKFLDDNHVVAMSDNRLDFYNVQNAPRIETQIKVHNQIEQVIYNKENVIVYYGKPIESSKEDMNHKIVVYNFEGNVIDQYTMEETVRSLVGSEDHYYVISAKDIEFHNAKKRIWKASIQKDVKSIIRMGKGKYLLVLQHGYEIVRIKDI